MINSSPSPPAGFTAPAAVTLERKTVRKLVGSSLFVSAAAAGAIALSASAAFAAGWTVTNSNSNGNFTVALASGTTVTFTDVNTGVVFSCPTSTLNGNAPAGTNLPNPIAKITSGTFTSCTSPGSTGSATITAGNLNAVTYDASTDTVTGNITGIHANLSINTIFGLCTAAVDGSVGTTDGTAGTANGKDTYANGSGTLTIQPDPAPQRLSVTSTGGNCAGLINPGDPVTFQATYVGTDPIPPITARPS